jgi:hypothetical protein
VADDAVVAGAGAMTPAVHRLFAAVATLAVLAALVHGLVIAGTPDATRLARLDERRLHDLQAIAREIHDRVRDSDRPGTLRRELPQSLAETAAEARGERLTITDPLTGEPYGYTLRSASTYELCATFALPRSAAVQVFWNHPAGRHCFTIDALDPPP